MSFLKTSSLLKYSLNLGIRGATMGLKFLFALFLGRFFPEKVLGEYGLLTTTILISYLLLSLSFEAYAIRELIEKPKSKQLTYIKDVFIYFGIAFSIYTVFAIFFLNRGLLDQQLIAYCVILLFLETIIQILFSLFTMLLMPTEANLILFISQGSWIILALVLWYLNPKFIDSVTDILLVWIVGNLSACVYGLSRIIKYYKWSNFEPINWNWIKSGFPLSLLFFCSTIGYKCIEYADRYFIEFKLGASQLGVYVFYSQMANIMNAVINVTVILMLYPRLIENHAKGDFISYQSIKRKMYHRIIIIGAGVSLVAIIFMKFALGFIGKEPFYKDITVFYILLVSNLAMNFSFISHYCLYAMRNDKALVFTTIGGSLSSLVFNYFLIDLLGIQGAAIATCSSFVLIWGLKTIYVKEIESRHWAEKINSQNVFNKI